jgi:hypothetical protein
MARLAPAAGIIGRSVNNMMGMLPQVIVFRFRLHDSNDHIRMCARQGCAQKLFNKARQGCAQKLFRMCAGSCQVSCGIRWGCCKLFARPAHRRECIGIAQGCTTIRFEHSSSLFAEALSSADGLVFPKSHKLRFNLGGCGFYKLTTEDKEKLQKKNINATKVPMDPGDAMIFVGGRLSATCMCAGYGL